MTTPALIPPLLLGTATFTTKYSTDPLNLPSTAIVRRAIELGITGFDTSPYYDTAEELLGTALALDSPDPPCSRHELFLQTKVGRNGNTDFDYSPEWVRKSIDRSLTRLRTSRLDMVYCHDVEFVKAEEVLTAVTELRRIRDETGKLKYVGISGYPVPVLCDLADMILEKTGEPLDSVMSYANFTLQNTTLLSKGLHRFEAAGVKYLSNASLLGMGLLRGDGVPVGAQGDFHPSSSTLRDSCRKASEYCKARGQKLENIALWYGMDRWLKQGSVLGTTVAPLLPLVDKSGPDSSSRISRWSSKAGINVLGCSSIQELEESLELWSQILQDKDTGELDGSSLDLPRMVTIKQANTLAAEIEAIFSSDGCLDETWKSP
jgi:aryl-alcohol dehydrogenase-like predicted oxidoreductase